MATVRDERYNSVFALAVVAFGALVVQHFWLPLCWAAVLSMSTWPLYRRLVVLARGRRTAAAAAMTLVLSSFLLVPALLVVRVGFEEAPVIADFIAHANNHGVAVPAAVQHLPFGQYVSKWWTATLAQPHGLSLVLSNSAAGRYLSSSTVLKQSGSELLHRLIDCGFTLFSVFFFYRGGATFHHQLMRLGCRLFGSRAWHYYYPPIPATIRATVNGLVLVGLAEGGLIGVGYYFAGVPSVLLWSAATALLAILPFGAPVVFLSAAAWLAFDGQSGAAAAIAIWGGIVVAAADHIVRPTLIGNATHLPFLAILFGILGGIETFGLIGLFLGPVSMALLWSLWNAHTTPDSTAGLLLSREMHQSGS